MPSLRRDVATLLQAPFQKITEAHGVRMALSQRLDYRRWGNIEQARGFFVSVLRATVEISYGTETLLEQIRLHNRQNALVGYYGAALSNLMFMPEGAVIIEMRMMSGQWKKFPPFFHRLAAQTGMRLHNLYLKQGQFVKKSGSKNLGAKYFMAFTTTAKDHDEICRMIRPTP
eukprot:TRINITY_DN23570_c0_g1_i2.p1 TRINITY_DN23570_c0_g1~~TRINITY_DN23570_c0_g1_i2.p1  ORF type:complete len:172 (+),score=33.23 TRINITY_DN23570_c0_g1_i2:770-1285(+)